MISVCILAKNEEKLIKDCLDSVDELASEIIVVNNGSTDNTKNIALEHGCIVIDSPNTVIDEGRCLYLEKAKYPWIFIIDADERLDKNATKTIKEFLIDLPKNVLGVNLNNYQYIGNGQWSNLKLLRLIRNNHNISYQDTPIHADLETSIKEQDGIVIDCNASVHHIDILCSGRTKFKRERYKQHLINILDTENIKCKRAIGCLYCFLGLEFSAIDDLDKAESLYKKAINDFPECKDYAKVFLAQNYLLKNELNEASKVINSINIGEVFGINDQITYVKAEILYRKNRLEEAIRLIEENLNTNNEAHNYINLAILYQNIDPVKTINYIEKATEINNYINNDLIYIEGEKPNIFFQQNCILNSDKNILEIMEYCCNKIGDPVKFESWKSNSIIKEKNL